MIAWVAIKAFLSAHLGKIIIYGAIGLAVLYGGRLWLNNHDAKVYQQGKIAGATDMERAKKAQWEAQDLAIETQKRVLSLATVQLDRDRANLYRGLNDALRAVPTPAKAAASVMAVPDSELDGALRAISRQLAAQP